MEAIQQQLIEDDAFLIGRVNNDPRDLARRAKVTSSSEQQQGAARNVVIGPTRSVHGVDGVPRERTIAGTHRWMSDPAAGLPAWIQLDWPEPVSPTRLQLVFDTGMHRVLTMSLADSYTQRMHWGRPQEETVRDYAVESKNGDNWRLAGYLKDNFQRRNEIGLDGGQLTSLRISVNATNGLDHARICGVRVC
jgi:hypothetical protein